jgi:pilus assembly protein CpaF
MLMAMSQGNNGSMCTMHADTARSVFPKLAAYMSMASTGVPVDTMNLLIASSVHFVVHVRNDDGRRVVESILEVVDAEGSSIVSNDLFSRSTSVPAFASMRSGTAALLADHGFRARRELSWA